MILPEFEKIDFWSKYTFLDHVFTKNPIFLKMRTGNPTKRVPWRKSSESGSFVEFFSFLCILTFGSTVRISICGKANEKRENRKKEEECDVCEE